MKLKFKVQPYQTNAVESVVDCFANRPMISGLTYRIDPGQTAQAKRRQNLPVSSSLSDFRTFDAKGARAGCLQEAGLRRDAAPSGRRDGDRHRQDLLR